MARGSRAGRRNCNSFDEDSLYDEDYDDLDEFGNSYSDDSLEEDGDEDDGDGDGDAAYEGGYDDSVRHNDSAHHNASPGYNDPLGYMAGRSADQETSTQASARRINRRRDIYTAEMPPVEFGVLVAGCRVLQAA